MKCNNCRFENPEGNRFCQNCGAMLNDTQTNVPYQPGRQKPYQNASEEKPKSRAVVWVVLALFILIACLITVIGGGYYYFYLRDKGLALENLIGIGQEESTPVPIVNTPSTLQDDPSIIEVTQPPFVESWTDPNQAIPEQVVVVTDKHVWTIIEQTDQIELLSNYPLSNSWDSQSGLSPNKKWFAYFTGFEEENFNPQLLVIDLSNRQTIMQLPLYDPSTPLTFTEYVGEPEFEAFRAMQMSQSLAWSPDGSTLAFVAKRDGESADVYLFNPEDLSVTRISNEAGHANDLHWSPNGSYLQYLSTHSFGTGAGSSMEALWVYNFHYQQTDLIENLVSSGERFVSWTDDDHFLIASVSSICELHNLRLVNVSRLSNQVILNGCFTGIAYSPGNQNGMFSVTDFNFENCVCGEKIDAGLWIFGENIGYPVVGEIGLKKFEEGEAYNIKFIDQSNLFTVYGDGGLQSIYESNDFFRVGLLPENQALIPYRSPSGENLAWAALFQSDLWFSDKSNKVVKLSANSGGLPVWSADGQKLYFFEDNRVLLVSAPVFDSLFMLAELPGETIITLVR